ncbi:MAG: siderophore biosynthesis protein IucC, partial [Proteobacteria bacterium]
AILSGHPKILLNKGRLGWGASELNHYAPECARPFQLFWCAAVPSPFVRQAYSPGYDLLSESLSPDERAAIQTQLLERGLDPARISIFPVHPAQWDRILQTQYVSEIATGRLLGLGRYGDHYRPQISIRTLSNVTRPERADLKLSVSILNTSAVRGIAPKYIPLIPALSERLDKICQTDPVLSASRTEILREIGGLSYANPTFQRVSGAPYRYQESLGCIWRESTASHLQANERAVLTGALAHRDSIGRTLLSGYAHQSGLSLTQWLGEYFKVTVIPLYHLQKKYGVGIVAHGQNVVVRLAEGRPTGMFLKDFQGDLRLLDVLPPDGEREFNEFESVLTRLPAHYLIHDLITGHLVTVLRFLSAALFESEGLAETEFYEILSREIRSYCLTQGINDAHLDLLQPRVQRLLLNPVRFKLGYADSDIRPLPQLGPEISNPLLLFSVSDQEYS